MSKTVIITGASRGIGSQCAILFAHKGYNVVINYNKSAAAANSLAASLSARGFPVSVARADVRQRSEVKLMVDDTYRKYGSIDVLVNNAGVASDNLITDVTEDEWNKICDVNLKGVFNCSQAVLPYMIKSKSGKIINISSMWGICGASCEVPYSAAKAGVIGFTKALAKEVAPSGINVNCVAPGLTETEMNSDYTAEELSAFVTEKIPLGRMASPSEIASAVYFLSSVDADYITGQVLSIDGGVTI